MYKKSKIVYFIAMFVSTLLFSHAVAGMGIGQLNYYPHVQVVYSLTPPPDEPAKFREGITTDEKLTVNAPFYIMINAAIKAPGPFVTKSIDCALTFGNPQIIKVMPVQRQVQLRELKPGLRYAFRMPVTKAGDEVVRIVFKCEPQTAGIQNIHIAFDKNVDSRLEQSYDCPIKAVYYAAIDGQTDGPYDQDELKQKIQQGELKPETLVLAWGNTNWTAAKTVPELAPFFANAPPPVPQ
jgi:hypothetical protein